MQQQSNDPQVVLFQNHNKKNDKAPDLTGKVTFPDGKVLEIAAWAKVSKNGQPYFSGKLTEPFESQSAPRRSAPPAPAQRSSEVRIDF
jgi:uncharacterized protein (DUF736 family)